MIGATKSPPCRISSPLNGAKIAPMTDRIARRIAVPDAVVRPVSP
ncbi:MAG TPA: hypothetical protein VIN37_05430 [Candidatus Limnocylindria bacterium]